jgi:hypothetical protein
MAKTREAAEAVIERLNKDHEGMNYNERAM